MALVIVIISEHIAGPIMKMGDEFWSVSFLLPNEFAYCLLNKSVNQRAPRKKYAINAIRTLTQLIAEVELSIDYII
jgi:hypothetical protein